MSCCNHDCNQGRICPKRRLLSIAAALTGYAVVLGCLICAAMAAASWLALIAPHGSV